MSDIEEIKNKLRQFAKARDWEQFHSPKNLSMALACEAGELLEQFQWLTESQSKKLTPNQLQAVEEEIADILLYLIQLSDKLSIDLLGAAKNKIAKNEMKYPSDKVRGSSKKYTDY